MIYSRFSTFWISTQCSSLPSLRDLEMTVCMCMYVQWLFSKNFICFLAFHRQLEKTLFLVLSMILPLSSFSPYGSQKASECFCASLPTLPPVWKPSLPSCAEPDLFNSPACPLNVQRHLQAPWKTLSWAHFMLSLMCSLWQLPCWCEVGGGEPRGAAGRAALSAAASGQMDPALRRGPRVWRGGKWGLHH